MVRIFERQNENCLASTVALKLEQVYVPQTIDVGALNPPNKKTGYLMAPSIQNHALNPWLVSPSGLATVDADGASWTQGES